MRASSGFGGRLAVRGALARRRGLTAQQAISQRQRGVGAGVSGDRAREQRQHRPGIAAGGERTNVRCAAR